MVHTCSLTTPWFLQLLTIIMTYLAYNKTLKLCSLGISSRCKAFVLKSFHIYPSITLEAWRTALQTLKKTLEALWSHKFNYLFSFTYGRYSTIHFFIIFISLFHLLMLQIWFMNDIFQPSPLPCWIIDMHFIIRKNRK